MGVIDSGATRCAGGVAQIEYLAFIHQERGGTAPFASDSGVRFRFAGGEKSRAASKVTMWCDFMEGEPLDIHALQAEESPILLGMDFLNHIKATHDIPKALLLFEDGRCLPLKRLSSGHQAIDLSCPYIEGQNFSSS